MSGCDPWVCSEQWRRIPGYESTHSVSSCGRVWKHSVEDPDGGWFVRTTSSPKVPYPRISLGAAGTARTLYVHHLVLLAFVGPRPKGSPVIRHIDDVSTNNHLSNLCYGTWSENARDRERNNIRSSAPSRAKMEHYSPLDGESAAIIPDFPEYSATSHGRIFRNQTKRLLWGHVNRRTGYIQYQVRLDGKTYCRTGHWLVARAFLGPANGLHVMHLDESKNNNRLDNLRYGSRSENMQAAWTDERRGRYYKRGTCRKGHIRLISGKCHLCNEAKKRHRSDKSRERAAREALAWVDHVNDPALTARESYCLTRRVGAMGPPWTLQEIATGTTWGNMTREWARQQIASGLSKLRHPSRRALDNNS